MHNIGQIVANNVKRLRKERQLTLNELSDSSGVSTSMLGGIERGDTNPTITILDKIAYGFKIPLSKLIEEDRESIYYVASKDKAVYKSEDLYKAMTVFEYNKDYGFRILEIHMDPESERSSQGHNKGVVEFLIVSQGKMVLTIENKRFELHTGDAIRFEADKPHKLENVHKGHSKATNIIYYNRV